MKILKNVFVATVLSAATVTPAFSSPDLYIGE